MIMTNMFLWFALLLLSTASDAAPIKGRLIDLGYDLEESSMRWPTMLKFRRDFRGTPPDADLWVESYNLHFGEHQSTHMDAPSHFVKNTYTIEQIPLSNLFGRAAVIDISDKVVHNNVSTLDADDILAWEKNNGYIPDNGVLFVRTGWGKKYGNTEAYFGSYNDTSLFQFPGISLEAAKMITNYQNRTGNSIVGVGIDTPSLDPGDSTTFPAHIEILAKNIYGLENVANLDQMPHSGAHVLVMPIKTKGGSGGPCRIVAKVNQ